ncbi:MAG: hypothetical protein AABY22_34395, partial [Nanoarchaeota archaeon]
EGALRVTSGSSKAHNVKLDGDWITFDENNFNLNSNETNLLVFRVKPIILDTQETNKTHIKTIKVSGSNFPTVTKDITIFVPYQKLVSVSNASNQQLIEEIKRLKEILSLLNLSEGQQPQIIYKEPEFGLNLSASELRELLLNFRGIKSTVDRTANIQKENIDSIKVEIGEIKNLQNETDMQNKENSERLDSQRIIFFGIVGGITVLSSVWLIFNYLEKYQRTNTIRRIMFNRGKE